MTFFIFVDILLRIIVVNFTITMLCKRLFTNINKFRRSNIISYRSYTNMLTTLITIIIFTNALAKIREYTIYFSRLSMLGLNLIILICYNNTNISLNKGISLYGGTFNISSVTQTIQIFICILSSIILIYNSFYHRNLKIDNENKNNIKKLSIKNTKNSFINLGDQKFNVYVLIEYPVIILFTITGASFLMCAGDLISLFITLELQSYALYILSSIHRESEQSTWGGLTYFLLGGLSSCFILLGSALLYVNTGTTSLEGLYIITAITQIMQDNKENTINIFMEKGFYMNDLYSTYYINISLILISVGLLFKISAAPFHFWSPDVYDALPSAVTTYVAIIPKISIFVLLLDLVYYINNDPISVSWKNTLLISSMLSLIIGSILGLTQTRIKKVLAYSTISHVGFMLLALCVNNTESIQAYIFYILSYSVSNLNAFVIIISIGYILYLYVLPINNSSLFENNIKPSVIKNKEFNYLTNSEYLSHNYTEFKTEKFITTKNTTNDYFNETEQNNHKDLKDIFNSPLQLVQQLKGFYFINSYLCISLTITLFSFIGIPPLIGFFAKQMVLSAALDNGYIFITLIAILTSVIGAVYYLNLIKNMFFFQPDYIVNPYLTKWLSEFDYFDKFKSQTLTKDNILTNEIANMDKNVLDRKQSNKLKTANHLSYKYRHLSLNTALSVTISILTLALLLFIFIPNQTINLAKILSLLLFN